MGHSGEDMLLLGHTFTERRPGPEPAGRRKVGPGGRQLGGEPDPRSEDLSREASSGRAARDVAFEEADDLDGHESGSFACHAGD